MNAWVNPILSGQRLQTFSRAVCRRLSTVKVGTAYENLAVSTFKRLGANIERVGGAGDQGVDFRGPWSLPNHQKFYMVGQCKFYERRRVGPSIIREWEGVMTRQDLDTLGVLVASSGYTSEGIQVALSSVYPIALVTLAGGDIDVETNESSLVSKLETKNCCIDKQGIRGFVWNKAADPFIGRLVVTKKHYDVHMYDLDDPAEYTMQLLWDGKPLPEGYMQ